MFGKPKFLANVSKFKVYKKGDDLLIKDTEQPNVAPEKVFMEDAAEAWLHVYRGGPLIHRHRSGGKRRHSASAPSKLGGLVADINRLTR